MGKNKARVGVRLKEAVGKNSLNRSQDLDALTQKFNALQEKQKNLIIALKTQHASICQMAKSRVMVADNLAAITKDSELYDCAGQMPSETLAKEEVCSYASIHHNLASRTKMYADKYGQFVINYAIEWDKVVTQRVMTGLKEAEKLRRDLDHYQKKTESLRQSVNGVLAKGKQVDKKTEEKLRRNEEKLKTARLEYNKVATSMCVLIEEVTDRAWKDIHPMLVKITQFDYTLSSDETKALADLNTVESKLKKLAEEHQLKPQNRLKDIETLKPALLSTKKAEETNGLALEGDPMGSGAFGNMSDGMAMPPGTLSSQGMGGFPVPIPSSYSGISRASSVTSMSSFASGNVSGYNAPTSMNTSEMLAIAAAAAPPPTMDQVNDATNALTISTTPSNGYSSYGGTSPAAGGYARSSSMASYDADSSIASYASAPAPFAAPAPAAPPPPPPSSIGGAGMSSMYGSTSAPVSSMYGTAPAPVSAPLPPSYGMQQSSSAAPWTNGAQQPMSPSNQYGQPSQSPTNQYGQPPQSPANPFGQPQQPPNQFGAPAPLSNPYGSTYGGTYGNQ